MIQLLEDLNIAPKSFKVVKAHLFRTLYCELFQDAVFELSHSMRKHGYYTYDLKTEKILHRIYQRQYSTTISLTLLKELESIGAIEIL